MVRGHDLRPTRVYERAVAILNNPVVSRFRYNPPPWLKAMEKIPPSEIMTRPLAVQHRESHARVKKPKHIFKPQQIVYEEDQLRRAFYRDHPWELARPRIILEIDGKDTWRCDWSRGLQQPGIPLSGECVVQRQLWMMRNVPGITKQQAYDKVRKEFYALRQEEDIERRIAKEEAMMVGAYFGKNRLQISVELEDLNFERWKTSAVFKTQKQEVARAAGYTSFGREASADEQSSDGEAVDFGFDETESESQPQAEEAKSEQTKSSPEKAT